MKGVILAAGLGTRLLPLTQTVPKALLPLQNKPLISYPLALLRRYGLKEVAINLHHLGDQIHQTLGDGSPWRLKIHYSWEKEILGTGGGIKKASSLFPNESLLIMNCDVLIDLSLDEAIQFHKRNKAEATMVLHPREPGSPFSPIEVNQEHQIVQIGGETNPGDWVYTGVQILEPSFLERLPSGSSGLIEHGYQPALTAGLKICGFPHDGYWNDIGTLDRYRQAEQDLTSKNLNLSVLE